MTGIFTNLITDKDNKGNSEQDSLSDLCTNSKYKLLRHFCRSVQGVFRSEEISHK